MEVPAKYKGIANKMSYTLVSVYVCSEILFYFAAVLVLTSIFKDITFTILLTIFLVLKVSEGLLRLRAKGVELLGK